MTVDIDDNLIFRDDELAMLSRDFDSNPDYNRVLRHRLFVYGTMRQGAVNHSRLHQCPKTRFLGYVETEPLFDLLIWQKSTGTSVPIVTTKTLGNASIAGELYEVSGSLLKTLDLCEGHPDVYERVKAAIGKNSESLDIKFWWWIYLFYVGDKRFEIKTTRDGITRNSEGSLEYKPCQSENVCSQCTTSISR